MTDMALNEMGRSHVLIAESSNAQIIRRQLEELHLWNGDFQCRRISPNKVALPVSLKGDNSQALKDKWPSLAVEEMDLTVSKKCQARKTAPSCRLREKLQLKLKEYSLSEDLMRELPTKWEKHEDLILLPCSSFISPQWNIIADLWDVVAQCLNCKRLARHSTIAQNGFRSSQVKILLGKDGEVTHTDNGVKYSYDVTKCMFSAGNISEKLRLARLNCKGEIIVDLYAGIGYFTLPYLVHAKADHVHACEWNPDAVSALQNNLKLNGVSERCTVHYGDNRELKLTSVADRVNLGLIPSSEDGWPVAGQVLKDTGGVLHVHGNVTTNKQHNLQTDCSKIHHGTNNRERTTVVHSSDLTSNNESLHHYQFGDTNCFDKLLETRESNLDSSPVPSLDNTSTVSSACSYWSSQVQEKITILLETVKGGHWSVKECHIELVKWYAPHIMHVVLDLECRPRVAFLNNAN
uniref:tRNA(Phe) (4-demethylwyosine(37)-C(7)) aminocarboxypropyltransferase n=1 Tax=Biomphalaria glabrata TaxID=6526 RepID=A0A2C9JRV7_BIOGL